MKYKALKPCRFDRFYSIGETIPADAVACNMASKLIAIGLITPLPDEYAGFESAEDEQVPQEGGNEFAEVNGQAEENSSAEGEQVSQESGNEFAEVNGQAEENSSAEGEQVSQESGNEFAEVNGQAEENSSAEDEQVPQEGDDKPERKRGRKPKSQTAGE